MGGEEAGLHAAIAGLRGLPPRGRGRDAMALRARGEVRITPAWAGKSLGGLGLAPIGEDYPRVGGEEWLIMLGR